MIVYKRDNCLLCIKHLQSHAFLFHLAQVKKFITVILIVLYAFTSTGATLQLHYCMGELAGWGIGYSKSESCITCGMKETDEKSNDCCKNKYTVFKNDSHKQNTDSVLQVLQILSIALPPWPVIIQMNYFPGATTHISMSHSPPGRYDDVLYIRNCAFLI